MDFHNLATGGGSGSQQATKLAGGNGFGGGAGQIAGVTAADVDGTANTGGGGGGGTRDGLIGGVQRAGNGGSGVVIISYPTGSISATGGTITTSGGNTIHTFMGNGTFTVL